jgi:hypothetical protein
MNFFILLLIFCAFVAIGVFIYVAQRNRRLFFESLVSFCDHFSIEIAFSKNTIGHVIERYHSTYSPHFAAVLLGYRDLIESKQDLSQENLTRIMWNRLKPHEANALAEFFYELGRHSSSEEEQKLSSKKLTFNKFRVDAEFKQRNEGAVLLKLCVVLGLAVVILMI